MTLEKLEKLLQGQPAYRLRQAAQSIFREGVSSFAEISTLPLELRRRLEEIPLLCLTPGSVLNSKDDGTHKATVVLQDGKRVETVLMSPKPGLLTACISSQVGCALRCNFCATGLMGFSRNLSAEEITDQVLFWRQFLRRAGGPGRSPARGGGLSNIVYMGMGEPMLNLENVFESLRSLSDPERFGIGQRHLSVSTAGVVPGMERFVEAFPQVNLALSLHAATPALRTELVPINKSYPLTRLTRFLQQYFRTHNRKIFIEYVLLSGENDSPRDARALAGFLQAAGPRHLLHVNLIVWNRTSTPHNPSRPDSARQFAEILKEKRVSVTFRKNLGQDIEAACGQLVVSGERRGIAKA